MRRFLLSWHVIARVCGALGLASYTLACGDDHEAVSDAACSGCEEVLRDAGCQRCDGSDGGDDAGHTNGDGDGDGDGGPEPQQDAGEPDAGPASDIVGLSFQQLWPRTQDGQTAPHMHLTGLLFMPGGHGVLIWEKGGRISHYHLDGDDLILQGELRLEDVLSYSDCGMTAVVLDPEWETNHYLFATHCVERNRSVLVRYEFDGERYDVADSRALVLELGEPRTDSAWHNLTAIGFFDDAEHSMWAFTGEKSIDENAQDLSTNLGKVLRIVPRRGDGSAGYDPHPDNPFAGDPNASSGPDLYAWGLRSPWRGSISRDGTLFIGDVGNRNEEVNVLKRAGQNFGWSTVDGPCDPAKRDCAGFSDPVVSWNHSTGHRYTTDDPDVDTTIKRCAWIGAIYEPDARDRYEGFLDDTILFGDMCAGFVRALSVDGEGKLVRDEHVGHMLGLSGAAVGPDGYLYVTSFGSCASGSAVGGGIFRVLPRRAEEPAIIEPPLPTHPLVEDPLGPLPENISDTGIFADAELTQPIERAIRYEPTLPLWSNGSAKDRWLLLPEGGHVDNSDREHWDFPPGTLFFKTFAYDDGPEGKVETRIIRRTEAGYDYHVYKWNSSDRDATLMSLERSVAYTIELSDGTTFRHSVPSRLDCRSCHESNDTVVIGFDELRLNGAGAGVAGSQLVALAEAGVFTQPLSEDLDHVEHEDEITERVLGYLHGNCAHCHNTSPSSMSVLSLEHPNALQSTIGIPTMASGQAEGIRIVPQSPATSVLFMAFSGETEDDEIQPMPPLGVNRIDAEAVELLRGWIEALPVE